jgi:hypothetical protein
MPRASIKQRKRTVVCRDCKKTVSDLTVAQLKEQGWSVATPMWAISREAYRLGGKDAYYEKYPEHRRKTTDCCPECREKHMISVGMDMAAAYSRVLSTPAPVEKDGTTQ